MNKYLIRIVVKEYEKESKILRIGEFTGNAYARSKKHIQDQMREIYHRLKIDPKTVELVEIEETED